MSALLALAMQVAAPPSAARPIHAKPQSSDLTQKDLDSMADACGAPRAWLKLRPQDVLLDAGPNADFAKVQCVLRKVYPVLGNRNLAFLGNAAVSEDK